MILFVIKICSGGTGNQIAKFSNSLGIQKSYKKTTPQENAPNCL
jgi:hypothetical protein